MLKSYKDVLNELSKKYKKSSRWRTINSEIKSLHELTLDGDEEVNELIDFIPGKVKTFSLDGDLVLVNIDKQIYGVLLQLVKKD